MPSRRPIPSEASLVMVFLVAWLVGSERLERPSCSTTPGVTTTSTGLEMVFRLNFRRETLYPLSISLPASLQSSTKRLMI
ncbi:hypothetical protein H4582DRAFT_1983427 [Lactarius indigo]|nr:hypothetical protein H4582DRAFT_1983427 [Lactarius indigo]